MVIAWLLTPPAAGSTAGLVYAFMRLFGSGSAGPIIVAALGVIGLTAVFTRRTRTAIDTAALLKVVVASLVGGVLIATAFSVLLYGADLFVRLRRDGQTARAVPFAVVGAIGGLVFVAAVVAGSIIMTTK